MRHIWRIKCKVLMGEKIIFVWWKKPDLIKIPFILYRSLSLSLSITIFPGPGTQVHFVIIIIICSKTKAIWLFFVQQEIKQFLAPIQFLPNQSNISITTISTWCKKKKISQLDQVFFSSPLGSTRLAVTNSFRSFTYLFM